MRIDLDLRPASALLLAWLFFPALPCRAALSPNGERLLDEGIQRLYNLDYELSRASFRRLIELEPDNPFGYLFEAGAIWWQSSQEYSLFKDTPTLQGLFEQDIEAALRKAKLLMDSDSKLDRADAYFVSGMALGTRGQWGLLRGRWMDAYFDGKKAIKHLKKCLKLDPSYNDAYLGLGVFDYQAARLPGIIQYTPLLGVRGDEQRGLERIRLAMEEGRYASRQAAQLLSSIYIADKRDYERAFPLISRLRGQFPQSPYFQFLEVFLLHRRGEPEESLSLARDLFEKNKTDLQALNRKLLSLFCGLTADQCLNQDILEDFLAWIDFALEPSRRGKQAPWLSFLRLYRGQALDILGRREEALLEYKRVLAAAFPDFHGQAAQCLAQPCTRQSVLESLRALSRLQ